MNSIGVCQSLPLYCSFSRNSFLTFRRAVSREFDAAHSHVLSYSSLANPRESRQFFAAPLCFARPGSISCWIDYAFHLRGNHVQELRRISQLPSRSRKSVRCICLTKVGMHSVTRSSPIMKKLGMIPQDALNKLAIKIDPPKLTPEDIKKLQAGKSGPD